MQYVKIKHHESGPKYFMALSKVLLSPSHGCLLRDAIISLPKNDYIRRTAHNEIVHYFNHVNYRLMKDLYLLHIKII